MIHIHLTLALFLTLVTAADADGQRTCRILFLGAANDANKELILFDGLTSRKVQLPDMNLSPVYDLPAGPLKLRLLQNAPSSPEEIPAAAPSSLVGENVTHFYLIASPDATNTYLPVSMQVINAEFGKFAKGEMLWLNLTDKRIAGTLGSQKLDLQPKSHAISKAPADRAGSYPVALHYQIPADKKVWPICETSWSHNPAGRIVMFAISEKGSKIPRIVGFPDFRVEKEPQKQNAP